MSAPQLSAEVLKALKANVQQRLGEEVRAAVITVPAAFELPQCEATRQAAELAGFIKAPLLQEPVAAALAYGFQSESDRVFWLVFDLGGGTFDAAVVHVRDGSIQVVNHGGDNHLGAKLLDWKIVDELLVPALLAQRRLPDFWRGNPRWRGAIAKLKAAAEQAKLQLSRELTAEVYFEFLCQDEQGAPVEFQHALRRGEIEALAEPVVLRSINICKRVLAERRLGIGDIEKVLLVGGPTLAPYLRSWLADPQHGLGIPLEFSCDPLTVVARGAAIFAATQRLESAGPVSLSAGQLRIELEYKPVGADTEPWVGGKVGPPPSQSLAGWMIELVNADARPPWRSGRLALTSDGTFMTSLWAEKGHPNTFTIELTDAQGNPRATNPDRFNYTIGLAITDLPLIHSLGVALSNNDMVWLIEKGTPLPVRRRKILHTAVALRRGQRGHVLRIPLMEGQHSRADRNQLIGSLEIAADQVNRDVPPGSEVELSIELDDSRLLRVLAYVPILDMEFEKVIRFDDYRRGARDPNKLRSDLDAQRTRLDRERERCRRAGDARAEQALERIDGEHIVEDVEAALTAAAGDPDAAEKCASRLLDLTSALDELEDALAWPTLVSEAQSLVEATRDLVEDPDFAAAAEEKTAFVDLERKIREAIRDSDTDPLRGKVREMRRLGFSIVSRHLDWWLENLRDLEKRRTQMSDPGLAGQLIASGRRAYDQNDLTGLSSAVQQLAALLPADEPKRLELGDMTY
jgi:molecular chaperone DnaK